MNRDEYFKIIGSLKNFDEDVADASINLIRLATAIVYYQNPDLAKLGVLMALPKYRKEDKLFNDKQQIVLDQLIEELKEISTAEVSRLRKKYIVKFKLEALEKDF